MDTIARSAGDAPGRPGVYFFFGPGRTLVYVGQASNLRRRLAQHSRGGGRLRAIYPLVREVRWEELAGDDAAAREAELILALRPAFNASLADDGRWTYVHVAPGRERIRFTLVQELPAGPGRTYGCFASLGTGVQSRPAIALSDGYTAFLRLLWAAGPAPAGSSVPAAVRGMSPPAVFDVAVLPGLEPALHSFLDGASDRLLPDLDPLLEARDAYMQPALRRDRDAAAGFFHYGPRAVRELRRRHGIRSRTVSRQVVERLLREEVEAVIGPFDIVATGAVDPAFGRRAARRHVLTDALGRLEGSSRAS